MKKAQKLSDTTGKDRTKSNVKMELSNYSHVSLIPVTEVFHVYENIKCEKCGKVLAEPKERIGHFSLNY